MTELYIYIRNNECARNIVNYFRETQFWIGIRQALFSSDNGSLEPLKKSLELLGIVSIFLSAINEVMSTRSKGILLGKVAEHFFPKHWLFQIVFYAGFAFMGIYAAEKEIVMTAALCLIGLGICFVYSLIMALILVFSHKARSDFIEEYFLYTLRYHFRMEWRIQKYKLAQFSKHAKIRQDEVVRKWWEDAQENVLDYAEYVGQEHSRNARYILNSRDLERRLVDGVRRWLNIEPSRKTIKPQDLALSSSFEEIFDCEEIAYVDQATYVLYTKCFPDVEDQAVITFKNNTIRSSLVWERLFNSVQDEHHRSRLAYSVLSEAKKQDNRTYTNLSCGLLQWLRLADCGIASGDLEGYLKEKINFIIQMRQAAIEDEVINRDSQSFLKSWGEIMRVAILILGCMEYLRPELVCHYSNCKKMAKEYISANIQSPIFYRDEKHCAVYAYLIFSIENYDVCKTGSVYVLDCVRNTISEDLKL